MWDYYWVSSKIKVIQHGPIKRKKYWIVFCLLVYFSTYVNMFLRDLRLAFSYSLRHVIWFPYMLRFWDPQILWDMRLAFYYSYVFHYTVFVNTTRSTKGTTFKLVQYIDFVQVVIHVLHHNNNDQAMGA